MDIVAVDLSVLDRIPKCGETPIYDYNDYQGLTLHQNAGRAGYDKFKVQQRFELAQQGKDPFVSNAPFKDMDELQIVHSHTNGLHLTGQTRASKLSQLRDENRDQAFILRNAFPIAGSLCHNWMVVQPGISHWDIANPRAAQALELANNLAELGFLVGWNGVNNSIGELHINAAYLADVFSAVGYFDFQNEYSLGHLSQIMDYIYSNKLYVSIAFLGDYKIGIIQHLVPKQSDVENFERYACLGLAWAEVCTNRRLVVCKDNVLPGLTRAQYLNDYDRFTTELWIPGR